jgi:hypothetical protein
VHELIEEGGCELYKYLPPYYYSPDLNRFEEALAKLKALVAQSRDTRTHQAP